MCMHAQRLECIYVYVWARACVLVHAACMLSAACLVESVPQHGRDVHALQRRHHVLQHALKRPRRHRLLQHTAHQITSHRA